MSDVNFKGVSKRFGSITAVNNLNMAVEHGEFIVLVGPSGCGKSTTLRMLAGLESITEGDILIEDRRVNDIHPRDRDIAMVFQSYALYPHMTVEQNMALNLKVRKIPPDEIRRRLNYATEVLRIGELLQRRPSELSGGQKQRVAVGRAIVREPKVFLFDEPLSNLDAKLRVQMRAEIGSLHDRLGATMVYVTHDQTEAMTLGSRIVVMREGLVQQVAPPLELFNEPANMFVAGFIGSPAMNFIEGTVRRDSGLRFFNDDDSFVCDVPAAAEAFAGQKIVIGFRPEHLRVSNGENGTFTARVRRQEPLGSEVILYLQAGSDEFMGRLPADAPIGETTLSLFCSPDKVRLFDPKTEKRVV